MDEGIDRVRGVCGDRRKSGRQEGPVVLVGSPGADPLAEGFLLLRAE